MELGYWGKWPARMMVPSDPCPSPLLLTPGRHSRSPSPRSLGFLPAARLQDPLRRPSCPAPLCTGVAYQQLTGRAGRPRPTEYLDVTATLSSSPRSRPDAVLTARDRCRAPRWAFTPSPPAPAAPPGI